VHRQQRQQLRRVGIEYLVQAGGRAVGIEKRRVIQGGWGVGETIISTQQGLQGGVGQQAGLGGPAGRVEVAVETELAEKKPSTTSSGATCQRGKPATAAATAAW
jgi:hypothetical protein